MQVALANLLERLQSYAIVPERVVCPHLVGVRGRCMISSASHILIRRLLSFGQMFNSFTLSEEWSSVASLLSKTPGAPLGIHRLHQQEGATPTSRTES